MATKTANALNNLYDQVTEWVKSSVHSNWTVKNGVVRSDPYGREQYPDVEGLIIYTGDDNRIHLEPLGKAPSGKTTVEMYAWPTLVRVRLVGDKNGDRWGTFTDVGLSLKREWNQKDFIELCEDLIAL